MNVMIKNITPDAECANCGGTTKLHIQNPLGVFFTDTPVGRVYDEWHNKRFAAMSMCGDFHVTKNVKVDHDELFMILLHNSSS